MHFNRPPLICESWNLIWQPGRVPRLGEDDGDRQKIMKTKGGLLELAKQLGNVSKSPQHQHMNLHYGSRPLKLRCKFHCLQVTG